MAEKVIINNLSDINIDSISSIQSDSILFITECNSDLRVKRLSEKVFDTLNNLKVIYTKEKKDRYIDFSLNSKSATIILDVSLIDRAKLASIFNEIYEIACQAIIEVYIYYSLASYTPPDSNPPPPNKKVSSVHPRFMGWDDDQANNVMTIVGLGYEKDKAIGAVEYLESVRSVVFIPNSSESEYLSKVKEQNEHLIRLTKAPDRIAYNVQSPFKTVMEIDAVLSTCGHRYKPVLLPFGPKIFYACSLLAALAHSNASVWYVSGEENEEKKCNQKPVSIFGLKCSIQVLNNQDDES